MHLLLSPNQSLSTLYIHSSMKYVFTISAFLPLGRLAFPNASGWLVRPDARRYVFLSTTSRVSIRDLLWSVLACPILLRCVVLYMRLNETCSSSRFSLSLGCALGPCREEAYYSHLPALGNNVNHRFRSQHDLCSSSRTKNMYWC